MSGVSISVRNLSKTYKVYDSPADLLKEVLLRTPRHTEFQALQDVSFDVKTGEIVGIIGPNGAGKSTLLKIITGTLARSAGDLQVNGKVSAILELGTGFHPEYSGRENVILGGMCLGMSREEITAKAEGIIAFSELASVIDQPFKTYSSGMKARLTFATAISVEPEILIIDEALAAGDAYFVVKCGQRIRQICDSGATVLFVSHSTHQVASLCSRAIWIEEGKVREIGNAIDVCRRYDYAVHERLSGGRGRTVVLDETPAPAETAPAKAPVAEAAAPRPVETVMAPPRATGTSPGITGLVTLHNEIFSKGPVFIDRVSCVTPDGQPISKLRTFDPFEIVVEYHCDTPELVADTPLGLAIGIRRESDELLVTQFSTVNPRRDEEIADHGRAPFQRPAMHKGVITASFPANQLLAGEYLVSVGLLPGVQGTAEFYELHHKRFRISVLRAGYPSGAIFYPNVEWSHVASNEAT